jgi:hypothetical protein
MLFMIIERFKDRDPVPIYARLRERGAHCRTDYGTSIAGWRPTSTAASS